MAAQLEQTALQRVDPGSGGGERRRTEIEREEREGGRREEDEEGERRMTSRRGVGEELEPRGEGRREGAGRD